MLPGQNRSIVALCCPAHVYLFFSSQPFFLQCSFVPFDHGSADRRRQTSAPLRVEKSKLWP